MSLPAWDPDAYDRQIARERATRERLSKRKPPSSGESTNTINYTDRSIPRGEATPAELQRRQAAERAMRNPAAQAPRRRPWPLPEPKLKPSGRWLARVTHKGRVYERTFHTKREAQQFIRTVTAEEE